MSEQAKYRAAFVKTVQAMTVPDQRELDLGGDPNNQHSTEALAYNEAVQSMQDYARALVLDSERRASNYAERLRCLHAVAEAACEERGTD